MGHPAQLSGWQPGKDGRRAAVLEGERIRLRAVELADAERMQRWLNDPGVQWTGRGPRVLSRKALEKMYEKSTDAEIAPRVVEMAVETHDGRHIGMVQVTDIDWVHRHATVNLLVGEADYKWRGFEEVALRLAGEYAFRLMNLNRLAAGVAGDNHRMQKCLEIAGFRVEGRMEAYWWTGTRYEDRICMRLLAQEYGAAGAQGAN